MPKDARERMMAERRSFIKNTALMITVQLAARCLVVSPAEATDRNLPLNFLTSVEAATLEHLAESMVPGAAKAGVVHFVDSQLAGDPNNSLLIARYYAIEPPHGNFYRAGLMALDRAARAARKGGFAELSTQEARQMARALLAGEIAAWRGPSSALFYQCVRSDAVDVVYGTPAGFAALGIPYMQHILPPKSWS